MVLNLALAGAIGLMPGLGNVLLTSFRPNVRNAALLEEYLRMRGRSKEKEPSSPPQPPPPGREAAPASEKRVTPESEKRIELPEAAVTAAGTGPLLPEITVSPAPAELVVPGPSGSAGGDDSGVGASAGASAGAVPEGSPPPHGDEKDRGAGAVPGDSDGDDKGEGGSGGAAAAPGGSDGDDQGVGTSISRGAALDAPEPPIHHRDSRFVEEVT
jgi:hypothetical protein